MILMVYDIPNALYTGDPTVAAVWRRQTFTAAVESCSPEMSRFFLSEHMANLTKLLDLDNEKGTVGAGVFALLEAAYEFSRMLHGAPSSSGGTVDAFYRAFVPDVASPMNPRQIELVKRCHRTERGELDRVGATVFPGLVKVSRSPPGADGRSAENVQTVVRRAQVICECALNGGAAAPGGAASPMSTPPIASPPPSGLVSPPPSVSPPVAFTNGGGYQ